MKKTIRELFNEGWKIDKDQCPTEPTIAIVTVYNELDPLTKFLFIADTNCSLGTIRSDLMDYEVNL